MLAPSFRSGRFLATCVALAGLLAASPVAGADHQIGLGIRYWEVLDNIEDDLDSIDDAGESYVFAYQMWPSQYFRWEFDLEYSDRGFQGGDEMALTPIAYALFGRGLYGGLGVGVTYSDSLPNDGFSDAIYAARAGINLDLLPHVKLDLHGNYRVEDWALIDEGSTDLITVGALLRVDL